MMTNFVIPLGGGGGGGAGGGGNIRIIHIHAFSCVYICLVPWKPFEHEAARLTLGNRQALIQ